MRHKTFCVIANVPISQTKRTVCNQLEMIHRSAFTINQMYYLKIDRLKQSKTEN